VLIQLRLPVESGLCLRGLRGSHAHADAHPDPDPNSDPDPGPDPNSDPDTNPNPNPYDDTHHDQIADTDRRSTTIRHAHAEPDERAVALHG
jgi:hypothetical protein